MNNSGLQYIKTSCGLCSILVLSSDGNFIMRGFSRSRGGIVHLAAMKPVDPLYVLMMPLQHIQLTIALIYTVNFSFHFPLIFSQNIFQKNVWESLSDEFEQFFQQFLLLLVTMTTDRVKSIRL